MVTIQKAAPCSKGSVASITLENANGMRVTLLSYGATIQSILVPDKDGRMTDVLLGYDRAADYEVNSGYLGACIGRNGNRIAGAAFCLNGHRYVGMVGTRRPTKYGLSACRDLSLTMAERGVVIVSGLAEGLDGAGHRAAVEAGQQTVAFLGTAINKTFPAVNVTLRAELEALGGAVLSEYPPDYTGKMTGTFLARNRLIAGLSEALCVAEARTRSGTLNTVSHAEEYGRPVFAVPGSIYSPTSEGTNELLRTGRARALCTADDVLDTLHIAPGGTELVQEGVMLDELTPNARTVLAELGPKAQTADDLAAATGLAVQAVLAALMELEFAGAAVDNGGGRYTAA